MRGAVLTAHEEGRCPGEERCDDFRRRGSNPALSCYGDPTVGRPECPKLLSKLYQFMPNPARARVVQIQRLKALIDIGLSISPDDLSTEDVELLIRFVSLKNEIENDLEERRERREQLLRSMLPPNARR